MTTTVDAIGTFTIAEMERALGFAPRTVELLKREELMQGQVSQARRGRPARHTFNAFSRLTTTGALAKAMDSPVTAARIVNEIMPSFEQIYGTFPPYLVDDVILGDLLKTRYGNTDRMRAPDGEICPYRAIEQAWRNGLVAEQEPHGNDFVLIIVDGEFVGATSRQFISQPQSILSYHYLGKSGGVKVYRRESEEEDKAFVERIRVAEADLRLNISLALRGAVIKIVRMREELEPT